MRVGSWTLAAKPAGPVAARKSRPQRQQGTGRKGLIGGRRFGPGKRWHWCAAVERVLGSLPPARPKGGPRREESDRKRPWLRRPACAKGENPCARVDASNQEWRRPLPAGRRGEGERSSAFCEARGQEGHDWRTRHQIAASLGAGDAFGLFGAKPADLVRPQHERVGERPGVGGEVREVRASRSRVGGHQGCSLTTSWLQRSSERHPVLVGSSGWTSQGVLVRGERRGRACGGVPSP